MNFKLTIIALFFSFALHAQEKKQNDTIKIEINSNTKTIYVLGGIASVITKEDLVFAATIASIIINTFLNIKSKI